MPTSVVESLRTHAAVKDYLPVKGLLELRQAVAQFHRLKDNVTVSAENVLIGPGSKELLFLLNLVFYGDVIVPTPCWVSYVPQAKILGRPFRLLRTTFENEWRLTADQHLPDDFIEPWCGRVPEAMRRVAEWVAA